jgi:hypothetical protein
MFKITAFSADGAGIIATGEEKPDSALSSAMELFHVEPTAGLIVQRVTIFADGHQLADLNRSAVFLVRIYDSVGLLIPAYPCDDMETAERTARFALTSDYITHAEILNKFGQQIATFHRGIVKTTFDSAR